MSKLLWLPLPSQEYLRECFDYDPKTGILTWRTRPSHHFKQTVRNPHKIWNAQFPGREAGKTSTDGHRIVGIENRYYKVARIVFKLMTGREPHHIDHRDRNPLNNRWNNLRAATQNQNCANTGVRSHNKIRLKGVYQLPGGTYRAKISINKKSIHLGCFPTAEEAHAAYLVAAQAQWGEFASDH